MTALALRVGSLKAALVTRYSALTPRERALVLTTCIVGVGFMWGFALWLPAEEELQGVRTQLAAAERDLGANLKTSAALRSGGSGQELAALRLAVAQQRAEVALSKSKLQARIADFVPPDQTERLLEDVLTQHPGMRLEAAEVLAAVPLKVAAPAASDAATAAAMAAPALFKHGIRLELAGSYLDALDYLHDLERMPWGLAWDRIDFQVVEHPKGRLVLELHTISDREEWVGA